jgi:hypothetical protein
MPTTVYNRGLQLIQSGLESTKGTLVAATSKCAVEQLKITPIDEYARPKIAKGLVLANRGNEVVVRRGVEWEIPETPVVYDQLQHLLAMAYGVGAVGGGPPYTSTWTRVPTANPGLASRTFEYRMTDGATPSDWKFGYGMLQELAFSGGSGEQVKFSAKGFGRRIQTATLTAGQAVPAIVQGPVALSTLYIDTTFAGLGGTNIAGQLLSWKYTFSSGAKPLYTNDARSDLDFNLDGVDPDEVKVMIELVMLATAGGQWATEKTAAEAGTLRAVEIRNVVSANATLKLQALVKHTPASIFPSDEQDGQQVITLQLEGSTDDVNFAQAVLVNTAGVL